MYIQLTSLNTLAVAWIQRVEIVGVSTTSSIDKSLTRFGFLVVEISLEICQTVALFFLHVANICGIKITVTGSRLTTVIKNVEIHSSCYHKRIRFIKDWWHKDNTVINKKDLQNLKHLTSEYYCTWILWIIKKKYILHPHKYWVTIHTDIKNLSKKLLLHKRINREMKTETIPL